MLEAMFSSVLFRDVGNVNVRRQGWQNFIFLQYYEFGGRERINPVFGPFPERWEVRRSTDDLEIVG